ncbi:MAG TPA: hypothetical protein VIM61_14380 [Chthoniobacterales bacterium]|jgi:hypothetical protein
MSHGIAAIFGIALAGLLLGLSACSTNDPDTGRPRESNIPWNRPASWEGPGVYGSAINQR